ncbi:MAG: extracellular solute-binding protein [Clostridiales bacterium]|nr:extracellular solute-binding protein [Clostridiales bacterium]
MKKALSILLAAATAVSVCGGLAACGGDDSTTITVWAPVKSIAGYKQVAADWKKAHSEYKDWTIKFSAHEESVVQTDLGNDMSNKGDIFFFPSDHLYKLVQKKAVAQLPQSYAEEVAGRDHEDVVEYAKNGEGKNPYAYPATYDNGYMLYYDKDLVGEKDIESLDTLQAAAKSKKLPFIWEYSNGYYSCSMFLAAGITFDYNADHTKYNTNVNSDEGKAVLKACYDYLNPDTNGNGTSPTLIVSDQADTKLPDGFGNKQIIAGVGGSWVWPQIKASVELGGRVAEDVIGVTVLPKFTYQLNGKDVTKNMYSLIGGKFCGVNAQKPKDKQKAAHSLASYLTGYEGQKVRFQTTNAGPSNKELAAEDEIKNNMVLQAFQAQKEFGYTQNDQPDAFWSANLLSKISTGDIGISDISKSISDWADLLIKSV